MLFITELRVAAILWGKGPPAKSQETLRGRGWMVEGNLLSWKEEKSKCYNRVPIHTLTTHSLTTKLLANKNN